MSNQYKFSTEINSFDFYYRETFDIMNEFFH